MSNEKRSNQRVSTNFPARWHGVSGTHEGRIEDLSVNGCFVNTAGNVDVGEMVSLLVQLPSGEWLPLRGKVAFFQQLTGFSVSLVHANDAEREKLGQLVGATQS